MNLRDKLDEFQENQGSMSPFNREQYKTRWVESVDFLYSLIQNEWLKDLIDKKQLSADLKDINLYEGGLGEYKINKLELKFISNQYIIFEPIAGLTLGGRGRIDMYKLGDIKNKIFLIRMEDTTKDIGNWKIVDPNKRTRQISFGEKSFEKMLNSWL